MCVLDKRCFRNSGQKTATLDYLGLRKKVSQSVTTEQPKPPLAVVDLIKCQKVAINMTNIIRTCSAAIYKIMCDILYSQHPNCLAKEPAQRSFIASQRPPV